MEKGKGIWGLIQDQEPIIYSPETKLDYNEIFKSLQEQSTPRETVMYMGGLGYKFMEAETTGNKELLAEANAELKVILDNLYDRLSELTGESIEDMTMLCKKYHHKHHLGYNKEIWSIGSRFVGDEDNEYDDRNEYTYLHFENRLWFIVVEWTDGYSYKEVSKTNVTFEDIKEMYL